MAHNMAIIMLLDCAPGTRARLTSLYASHFLHLLGLSISLLLGRFLGFGWTTPSSFLRLLCRRWNVKGVSRSKSWPKKQELVFEMCELTTTRVNF